MDFVITPYHTDDCKNHGDKQTIHILTPHNKLYEKSVFILGCLKKVLFMYMTRLALCCTKSSVTNRILASNNTELESATTKLSSVTLTIPLSLLHCQDQEEHAKPTWGMVCISTPQSYELHLDIQFSCINYH